MTFKMQNNAYRQCYGKGDDQCYADVSFRFNSIHIQIFYMVVLGLGWNLESFSDIASVCMFQVFITRYAPSIL